MTFIRVQNLAYDDDGNIVKGNAAIVESVYDNSRKGKNHCKQRVLEALGSVVYLSEDKKSGIFVSKTRGLTHYDVTKDEFTSVEPDDTRVVGSPMVAKPQIHTHFADSYTVLSFMKEVGVLKLLRNVSVKDDALYEKMICHTLHGILRNGSRITCDRFIEQSFISNVVNLPLSTLRTDSRYFETMGDYETKIMFFKGFVEMMRLGNPGFGKCCYVDSTPLPNEIKNLPLNRLCSHGVESTSIQTRMVLVLDKATGLPVWYDLMPGNELDLSSIMDVMERVTMALHISIEDLVLDAGYVTKPVIEAYNANTNSGKYMIARMPAKNGYCVKELFESTFRLFMEGKYAFVRNKHTYFGIKQEVKVFEKKEYAYVYLDFENASKAFQNYITKHADKYKEMTIEQQNWMRYYGGFFVLVSNCDSTPEAVLDDYFGRMAIEDLFKTGKEYLGLLPLNKENERTVNGKVLQDMIDLIVYLQMLKKTVPTGRSMTDFFCDLQSVSSFRSDDDTLIVEYANKQAREALSLFSTKLPARIGITELRKGIYL